eukprot:13522635-Alexandrium_andersonii.AAC.1
MNTEYSPKPNSKQEIDIPEPAIERRPEGGLRLRAGSLGKARFRGTRWGGNRFAALSEDSCAC